MPEAVHHDAQRQVTLERDDTGTIHVRAERIDGLMWGLGFAQALDRPLQLCMMRILGQGRAAEVLDGGDETVEIDKFFRRMNWGGNTSSQVAELTPSSKTALQAYVDGINARLLAKPPLELRLLGYRPEPWRIEDTIMLTRLIGYISLAQSQGEMERLLIQMVQSGLPKEKLDAFFGKEHLGGLDEALIKKVELTERIVPMWTGVPPMVASNNWVVAPKKSASGAAMLANDPHLEINRLPSVWYEVALSSAAGWWGIGATMPGLPGLIIGRSNDLSWGATYSFLDATDSWIEDTKDGQYRRGDEWHDFDVRRETIARKGKEPLEVTFYENEHGVLDGEPGGYKLCTRWAASTSGPASIESIVQMFEADSVEAGMRALGQVEASFNWVLADREGNIGFQMSGLAPKRRDGISGLVPLPGWDSANDWRGYHDPEDLPRCVNPDCGYFATANQDLNEYGKVRPLNLNQGPYRADRIKEVLAQSNQISIADMQRLQLEVYSRQAAEYMALLRPLLPDTEVGKLLRDWDCCYDLASQGAFIFEVFYRAMVEDVFGADFGRVNLGYVLDETGMLADFFVNFDTVLLSESSPWFGEGGREAHLRRALNVALETTPQRWGQDRQLPLSHILFGGKLPAWLGFDRGPFELKGGRATVHQGQIYRSGNRQTSFAPSIRFITDFTESSVHTSLAGGPSDRRFSKWYNSDFASWLAGSLKRIEP